MFCDNERKMDNQSSNIANNNRFILGSPPPPTNLRSIGVTPVQIEISFDSSNASLLNEIDTYKVGYHVVLDFSFLIKLRPYCFCNALFFFKQ